MNKFVLIILIFCFINEIKSSPKCNDVRTEDRIDCNPDNPSEATCISRGCCWNTSSLVNQTDGKFLNESKQSFGPPACYFPSNYVGYKVQQITEQQNGQVSIILNREIASGFENDISTAVVEIYQIDFLIC